jgi:hypothetical protein
LSHQTKLTSSTPSWHDTDCGVIFCSKFGSDFGINDNSWHAWCFSWSSAGNIQVFKDGAKQSETKSGVAAGKKVEAGINMDSMSGPEKNS